MSDTYVIPQDEREKCMHFLHLFKVQGKRADEVATEGQIRIFHAIVFQPHKRCQILCSTQYGKSLFVALACVIISCIKGEVVSVIAPSGEKSKIIMRYYIEHLGDSPMFYELLDANTKLERLRQEENKERIILRNGGGIFVVSANVSNSMKSIEASMGLGCKNVIQDESCLIPDPVEATIFRMIAGQGSEAFYCKIGNPFYRNHFLRSFRDGEYHKIDIDYKQGIAEGRYTEKFIEEARTKPFFDVLFENKFPGADAQDASGYSILVSESVLEQKVKPEVHLFGELRLGCDVAGEGKNYSVMVLRGRNGARVLYRENNPDTMNFTGLIAQHAQMLGVKKVYVDKVGIGKPVYDRLKEMDLEGLGIEVIGVVAGEPAEDTVQFFNKRAEMFWRLREWMPFSELEEAGKWNDLLDIRYKVQSDKRVKIKSKEEMRKDGVVSPDVADALSFTFYDPDPFMYGDTRSLQVTTSEDYY